MSNMQEEARELTREQFLAKYGVKNVEYWDRLHHDNDYPDYDYYGTHHDIPISVSNKMKKYE